VKWPGPLAETESPLGLTAIDNTDCAMEARPEQAPPAIFAKTICHSRIIKFRPSADIFSVDGGYF
jgi:hypothetical protein